MESATSSQASVNNQPFYNQDSTLFKRTVGLGENVYFLMSMISIYTGFRFDIIFTGDVMKKSISAII